MVSILLPSLFLSLFGFFNLLGIKRELLGNQVTFLIVALGFFFFARKIGLHFFKVNSKFFYWFFIILLVMTYVIGVEVRGSKRWIDLYVFNFQPSEFFKIFFVIFFAQFFTKFRKDLENPQLFLKGLGYFLIPTFIIFKQPDLGNALVYVVIFIVMLLFSPIPKKYLFYLLFFCTIMIPLSWFFLHPYQQDRIISFLNPEIYQQGTGYNMVQAIITTGSGKFLGKGLGFATQSKLFFLPENHTDFAFASLVEQFGFIGGATVLILYFFIILHLIRKISISISLKEEESFFMFYFLVGLFSFFTSQTLINIGMNIGLLPIVGIALPFISYGGSSLVSLFFAFGLIHQSRIEN